MASIVANIAIVAIAGVVLFCIIGQGIDAIIWRLTVGPGHPLDNIRPDASPGRRLILDVVRPIVATVIIFGGGLLTIALLDLHGSAAIVAGCWFFFLTQFACLSGRHATLNRAGSAMLAMVILLVGTYVGLLYAQ